MATHTLLLGAIGAILVGTSKSGVPGLGILAVPLMAMAFPTRTSVGTLLPMLIVGDLAAIAYYHRHAQWRKLLGLIPWVAAGMAAAALLLARIDNAALRPLLGGLVLALLGLEAFRRCAGWSRVPSHPLFTAGTGGAAGFATTMGNAAGPIMNLFFLSKGLPKEQFIGTAAWFFFLVNVTKVPIYARLGMITGESLRFDAMMAPLILTGAWLGVRLLPRIPQKSFNWLVMVLAAAAALRLVF